MGSGKSSAAINLMNEDRDNNYIYITPYLKEVERIKKSCITTKFYEPKFRSINGEMLTKFDSLHSLLLNQKNIASTHALFKRANEETRELIRNEQYILILDEVMDVIEQLPIKKGDIDILFGNGLIYENDGFIYWDESKKDYDSRYNDIRDMALNRNLIYHKDTILIWTFPADIFEAFKEVYILTYMFDGQIQKYYYDLNKIEYDFLSTCYVEGKHSFTEKEGIKHPLCYGNKINVYEGSLNSIGDKEYSLSNNWYQKRKESIIGLKNNLKNYFGHKTKAKSHEIMWTTFNDYSKKVKGKGYTKGFVPCTARATNEYKDKYVLAYTVNRYVNPIISGFFLDKGIAINEDKYALSEMIQWIWRSAIRDDNDIQIYIPSSRMRNLLKDWLNT
ncbi:hypothetical protein [Paenibacillus chitinolyticus]|uniref:hypothetical protein n=1 Tax=Paenibacillus chitinolyticus TaxID=79263 RepID=UPI00366B1F56